VTPGRPTVRRIDEPEEPSAPGPVVRLAEQRDVPRIAATLTLALGDSRWTRWALPADGRMQRLTRLHELDAGHRGVATGTAWVTDDVGAVAVWQAPEGAPGTRPLPGDVAAALARELPHLTAERFGVVTRTAERVAAARPEGPHWFLAHLGVRPTSRRQGLATAVLAPALARCDEAGLPAAVAVHAWANVRFLRGSGFTVAAATRTADDELPLWVLHRAPGGELPPGDVEYADPEGVDPEDAGSSRG
jgi:GNAT superfamily N-acetyltransferase